MYLHRSSSGSSGGSSSSSGSSSGRSAQLTPSNKLITDVQIKSCQNALSLFSHLYIKMMILPRQARDKHREIISKKDRFVAGGDTDSSCYVGRST
eukprot:COSAG06_NODE_16196_length_1014_cov_2.255738_1_plen_95_part_00